MMQFPQASDADIALLLEGTFPYVSGGVSSWINQIIRAYPQYRFAIVFLGSKRQDYGTFRYPLPDNVVHFEEHFLYEDVQRGTQLQPLERPGDPQGTALVQDCLAAGGPHAPQAMAAFEAVAAQLLPGGAIALEDFLYSRQSWNLLCQIYRDHCADPSFVDFFWTVRIMLQPLWTLARVAQALLPVRAVHCASTGYAVRTMCSCIRRTRTSSPSRTHARIWARVW